MMKKKLKDKTVKAQKWVELQISTPRDTAQKISSIDIFFVDTTNVNHSFKKRIGNNI